MSTQLIAHLKKKCEADDNVKILLSQWEFDQKLVGKALENIGGFYPHFSNHNSSHSQQILVNIERILGKDIELLSATDTWLILESAYWHDVGMLVDAKNAKDIHSNPDFLFMIKNIAGDKGHDLHNFCKAYEECGWHSAIASEEHPFDGVEKYRQLIGEWFRRNHDKRIGHLISDPFQDLGISSPRTELLPNRLYRYLGKICMSHGMYFHDVMQNLPYKQTGLGTENCHPLFVGCLLRLGDLFDLDDNRFCPVMAKHVSNMPSVSEHHKHKHLSLREFQLDKRTVKLVAECPDEMSYIEAQNWFGWIREEFQNQMSQWNLIVPSLKYGSLPTIEQLDVKMEVQYEDGVKKEKLLLNNKPMKFKLDEKNAMELLQGANLYNDEYSIYRELIQNSIDATMLRIWLEEDQEKLKELHPYHKDFLKILEKYPLDIQINKVKDIEGTLNSIWEFQIIDQGIGMNMVDLGYMQTMAGSSRNTHKKKIISEMPQWMRPSGEFGIGLHSAFLLTKNLPDEMQSIRFSSCSYFTREVLDIEMNSPLGGKQGYCFITKKSNHNQKIGTATKFYIKCNFDLEDIECDEVFNFLSKNEFEGKWEIIKKNKIYENILSGAPISVVGFTKKKLDFIWNEDKQAALFIKPFISKPELNDITNKFLFKGQRVMTNEASYELSHNAYCSYIVDIYGHNAKDVLNVSRDSWNSKFLYTHIDYLKELFEEKLKKDNSPELDLVKLNFFYDFNIRFDLLENWKEYSINGYSINEILSWDGFYISNFDDPEYLNRYDKIRSIFNDFMTLDGEVNEEYGLIYALQNFCQLNGYKKYRLIFSKKTGNYPLDLGLCFYSKDNSPINHNNEYEWHEELIKNDLNENVFKVCWKELENTEHTEDYYDKVYLNLYKDGSGLLTKFDKLLFKYHKYWEELSIFSPYQNINGKIELVNLDDLSEYVANKKNDLSNSKEYKKLYEKLVVEMDKYKETPQ